MAATRWAHLAAVLLLEACALACLFGCGKAAPTGSGTGHAPEAVPAVVTPARHSAFIARGAHENYRVTVDLSSLPAVPPPIDVLVLMDSTGSMGSQIESMRTKAGVMIEHFRSTFPDSRFAIASFADYYPLFTPDPRDKPWVVHTDFTADSDVIASALKAITLGFGGDVPEAYSRAIFEAAQMNWRPRAKRFVVLFGDSVAHPVDPGRDGVLGTADDLTYEQAVQALVAAKVKALGIYFSDDQQVIGQFNYLARQTGGSAIALQDASQAADAFIAAIAAQAAAPVAPELRVPEEFAPWVAVAKAVPVSSTQYAFDVTLSVPRDARAGRKALHLVAYRADSGTPIGRAYVTIDTGWLNDPSWQGWLIGLPAPMLLIALLRGRHADVSLLYFYRGTRLRKLLCHGLLVLACCASLAWGYFELRKADRPPLSDLLQRVGIGGGLLAAQRESLARSDQRQG